MLGVSKPLDSPNLIDFSAARGFHLYRLSLALYNQRTRNRRLTEMLPSSASASGSPTICHTLFSPVSSSISDTVAPNLIVSPESLETLITSARARLVFKLGNARLIDLLF